MKKGEQGYMKVKDRKGQDAEGQKNNKVKDRKGQGSEGQEGIRGLRTGRDRKGADV